MDPLEGLLSGALLPQLTLVADNVVQPGLLILRELLLRKLDRSEPVSLFSCENDAARILGGPVPEALNVIDCSGNVFATSNGQPLGQSANVEDLDDISARLLRLNTSTVVVIDGLNTLETYHGASAIYAMLKEAITSGIAIVALYHTDVPTSPSSSSALQLFPSLCSPSFCSSLLRLTVHPPSLLSHLHRAYGIERVGQEGRMQEQDEVVDMRVFDFLGNLHERAWASPLAGLGHMSEESGMSEHGADETVVAQSDPYDARDCIMDGLSSKFVGRCIVEYAMRGMNSKSGRRSEAAKAARGLSGVVLTNDGSGGPGRVTATANVAAALRIRPRRLETRPLSTASKEQNVDPASLAAFNLSLTDRQREARDGVELPYTPREGGEILYIPDSADDVDDSDPDEDLDL